MNPAKPLLALIIVLTSIQMVNAQSAVYHSDYLHDFRVDVRYNPAAHIMVITETYVEANPLDLLKGVEPMDGTVRSFRSFTTDAEADMWIAGLNPATVVVDRLNYTPPLTPWIVVGLTDTHAQALRQETLIMTGNDEPWRITVRIVPVGAETGLLTVDPDHVISEAQAGGGFNWPGGN